jgi:hypothetical protein
MQRKLDYIALNNRPISANTEITITMRVFFIFSSDVFRDAGVRVCFAIEDVGLWKRFTNEIGNGTHPNYPPIGSGAGFRRGQNPTQVPTKQSSFLKKSQKTLHRRRL